MIGGKTKRGRGTKLMAVAEALVFLPAPTRRTLLRARPPLPKKPSTPASPPTDPERSVGDRAYDSGPLDAELWEAGIEMIAPHNTRKKKWTQDGRKLRRYERCWKVERLFAWLLLP